MATVPCGCCSSSASTTPSAATGWSRGSPAYNAWLVLDTVGDDAPLAMSWAPQLTSVPRMAIDPSATTS